MTKTFKQQVEEICRVLSGEVPCSKPCPFGGQEHSVSEYECAICAKTDILSAHNAELDRIAEGVPSPKSLKEKYGCVDNAYAKIAFKECQAYIQAQKGS